MGSFAKCAQCALSSVLQCIRVAAQDNMQYTDCTLGHTFVQLQCKFWWIKSDPCQTLSGIYGYGYETSISLHFV